MWKPASNASEGSGLADVATVTLDNGNTSVDPGKLDSQRHCYPFALMHKITSHSSSWPGERDPSQLDVEQANELPKPDVLSDFRKALLSSQHARGNLRLMHVQLTDDVCTITLVMPMR